MAASKRTRIESSGDARGVRRNSRGQFKEVEDVDQQRTATRPSKSGQGDRGDRNPE
jgi:hypothetical protein